ncbi:DUF1214 domain-containing protein [Mangrovimicrobium sediminis]|uniref:DUF1214 domain-containing protein n=1 Tax=Mangrovimicrobium sediminis TaxID=2562682 RepID=A0A4Z0LZ80_9GAMM|nr:DUF1214 domain-containing protein [Haliea sp. SAOS-164]TGD72682.1 DUF1214 domain-containing protein [Haliea sp. SAOS-164]
MAFGDDPSDQGLREGWRAFCRQLEAAGEQAFKDYNPANPLQRADAFRFLTQNLGQAFDFALETRDTRYPAIHRFCTPYCKLGGDAADFTYQQAWIDGESVYRISGNRGSARFFNITVQGERPACQPGTDIPSLHDPFGDIPEANIFGHQLQCAWDGSFELYIGGPERAGNWLPTTAKSRKLFIRNGFDRWDELPATISIERVDMDSPRPLPTPETLVEAMGWAGNFLESMMRDWPDHSYHHSPAVDPDHVNAFPGTAANEDSDRKRGRLAASLCWELAADEALIVEFDQHSGFWMMASMGAFFTSMDYLYRPVSHTPARTAMGADGVVRLVLCAQDPGLHNWVDTQGFTRGNLIYRNLLSTENAEFRTRLVKTAELDAVLPADTPRVTAEQRRQQLWTRFNAIRRRYAM